MDALTIAGIAFGLAMDAFAVSVASGVSLKSGKAYNAFKMALFFGVFQMAMPILGWLGGMGLKRYIAGLDHFIAFGLLSFVGARMIYESINKGADSKKLDPFGINVLLVLAVATSIDALAIGVSFAFLNIPIITPVLAIGAITFTLSFGGVFIGNSFGHLFERKIEVSGGLILIGIGIKILIEHMV